MTTWSSSATTRPCWRRLPERDIRPGLHRPAVQHRPRAGAPDARASRPTAEGDRTGFGGRRYRTRLLRTLCLRRPFDDYLAFLAPRLRRARLLAPHGTLYFHIDYREAHYCKLLLDEIFGRECFLNEIIWAYDYGARAAAPLAGQARHDPRLRQGPRALPLRLRGGRPRAVHGARAGRAPRRRRAASCRPTSGGTRSCRRTAARRPATRRRSRRACSGAWWRPRRARATGAWTSSPAAARSARCAASSAGACWWTRWQTGPIADRLATEPVMRPDRPPAHGCEKASGSARRTGSGDRSTALVRASRGQRVAAGTIGRRAAESPCSEAFQTVNVAPVNASGVSRPPRACSSSAPSTCWSSATALPSASSTVESRTPGRGRTTPTLIRE